jgi:cytochrome c oxidase subunit 2
MSITPPEQIWWKPVHTEEKVWIGLALFVCLATFIWMPVWHKIGKQNPPWESYKVTAMQFQQLTTAFIDKYKVGEDHGMPVVHPPAGSDIYLLGQMWTWIPILELEKGKSYRMHLSSVDLEHGLSIYPLNMNFMALPDYDYVITLTPTEAGVYHIMCNEYCGIGHHTMVGKLIVKG